MKLVWNPYLRTLLVLLAWFLCIRKVYVDFDHSYWFDELIPLALIGLAGIVSLLCFLVDLARYRFRKNLVYFLPSLISVLCIAALIGIWYRLKQQDATPTVLYASHFYDGLNTLSLDLRANGTYKCEQNNFMGDGYTTRGKYTWQDSTIYLDRSDLFSLVKSDRLVVRTVPRKPEKKGLLWGLLRRNTPRDTLPETLLYQVNRNGEVLPSAIVLKVNKEVVGYHDH